MAEAVIAIGGYIARLEHRDALKRLEALYELTDIDMAILAQHAHAVLARLEDSDWIVRRAALKTLGELEPATLAQHADAVIARLEDCHWQMREEALITLGRLDPAALAQHANAVITRLEDSEFSVPVQALATLGKLEPATLAQYANAVLARLEDSDLKVWPEACRTLEAGFATCGFDFCNSRSGRSRFLGRLGWYRCRLRLRAQRLALYWYALPYRLSGPGHARDVEAWDRMNGNQDLSASKTPATRKRQKKATGAQTVGGTS